LRLYRKSKWNLMTNRSNAIFYTIFRQGLTISWYLSLVLLVYYITKKHIL